MYTVLYPVNALKNGGAEQQLLELVRGLDKNRFLPIVAPLYSGGVKEDEFRAVPGVEVVDLNRRGKYDPAPLWRTAALLRTRRVDVVQPFLSPATFFGLLPALFVRTPVKIVTERCGVRRVTRRGYNAYRQVEDRLTSFADVVVPNSVAGRDLLIQRGISAEKIQVIYNGINLERVRPDPANVAAHRARLGVADGGSVVGIMARLVRGKGHEPYLRAAARVAARCPEARFAIVGDGPMRAELETLTAELGLADRVVFFGYQSRVADCLAACDVVVSSSLDLEGCSNTILEAMAAGVPVVATDVGGNRELVADGKTGYLVPSGDDAALANGIEFVLTHSREAGECATRARQMIQTRFGLERMIDDYEQLYLRLLHQNAGHLPEEMLARQGAAR